MKKRGLVASFNAAFAGMVHVLRTQRNMRIHFGIAVVVLLAALLLGLTKGEIVVVLVLIAMVMVAELLNTAIEATIDLMTDKHNPLAKMAKDVAAAAVLVAAVAAVIIAYFLFADKLNNLTLEGLNAVKQAPAHVTFVSLLLVFLVGTAVKASSGRLSLQGGMPSIHAGLAAAAGTAIIFLSMNALVGGIAVLMALLVMESRLEAGIHSPYQVAIGAVLGLLLTVIVFQLAGG